MTLPPFIDTIASLSDVLLAWGWLFILFLTLWIAWEIYKYLKNVDYVSSIKWTYLQITVPEEAAQTPKSMESAFEIWGGMHKDPDIIEMLFEGYMLAWFSCELQCSRSKARYIMVVPTVHSKFFEGVIYGQYPTAEVKEVEDYAQEFTYQNLGKTFELYGTEMHLVEDDIYPIRTYKEYEDALAEDDRFIDPHQALIEAYTNIEEGEHFWVQILVRPVSARVINKWAEEGQEKISELSGNKKEKEAGLLGQFGKLFTALPRELMEAFFSGPLEPLDARQEQREFHVYNPSEAAEMEGILQKVSHSGFKTLIRVVHIAPAGKLHKPNISKAIGAFKQFNTFNLNSLKPDPDTKTNGPNYVLKQTRRAYRSRALLLNFQWRDFWGDDNGYMMTAEELATLYHFPIKYVHAPAVERATSGLGSPPDNLPYT